MLLTQFINIGAKPFVLACSGGSDSMAIADFYKRGNKKFKLAYFNHGTPQANDMQKLVTEWSQANNVPLYIGNIKGTKSTKQSPEEFFRNERYSWMTSLNETNFVTCHHLNDCVEQWIFSSMHGNPKLINPCKTLIFNKYGITVYRPFILNTKQSLVDWCIKHNIKWCEDVSNLDTKYPRNFIRHHLLEKCQKINPGILNTIKKKYLNNSYTRYI